MSRLQTITHACIPVFSSQLESSKQAADLSSIRSAYAEAAGDALTNGGKDGEAETGLMRHTGVFNKLGEATIGNLDLTTNPDANPIVKDYSVIVTVSAKDGSVSLKPGNGGHILGTTATAEDIEKLKKDYHDATHTNSLYYMGYNDRSYEYMNTDDNKLTLYMPSDAWLVDKKSTVTAEYGVSQVIVANSEGSYRRYYKWDGAFWYVTKGAGDEWVKVPSSSTKLNP